MVSWKEKNKLHFDKEQTRLSNDGCVPNTFKFAEKEMHYDYNTRVTCPFCLYENLLFHFPKKEGFRACPNCGNRMMQRTLLNKMTVKEFAKWVFDYRLNGFFGKVYPSFPEWCKKLKDLGISYEFWLYYHEFKGEISEEQEGNDWH